MAAMTKFPVAVDPEQLDRARKVLGTTSKAETIRAALDKVIRDALVAEEIAFLESGGYAELSDPKFRAGGWRDFSDLHE